MHAQRSLTGLRLAGHCGALTAAISLLSAACGEPSLTRPDAAGESNDPPRIAEPSTLADHDLLYRQKVVVWDQDGDSVVVSAVTLPTWLAFYSDSLVLSGIPGEQNLGDHLVELVASDGVETTRLSFTLTVRIGVSSLIFEGPWLASTFFHFGHDGHPYETDNFRVYSGFCVPAERQRVALVLEEHFSELKDSLRVTTNDEFAYVTPVPKLDVFLSKYQHDENHWGGGFHWGFVYRSSDSPYYYAPQAAYDFQLKHELMHVVEYLLDDGAPGEVWFREGIADYVSELEHLRQRITSFSVLSEWMEDNGNPVGIHEGNDYPLELVLNGQVGGYYASFELAFRYLVDSNGLGKTLSDVKGMYLDQRNGSTFAETFEKRMGMSLSEYEANFRSLMRAYLDP